MARSKGGMVWHSDVTQSLDYIVIVTDIHTMAMECILLIRRIFTDLDKYNY